MPVDWIAVLPSVMPPLLAVSSPSSTFANVDLPQPDSPTMATVSDSRASKLIDSFALTTRLAMRRQTPRCLRRGNTSWVGYFQHRRAGLGLFMFLVGAGRQGCPVEFVEAHAPAVVPVMSFNLDHRNFGGVAEPLDEMVAARAEIAALGALVGQRQLAGNGHQRP